MRNMFRTLARAEIGAAVAVVVGLTVLVLVWPLALRFGRESLAWSGELLSHFESGLRTWGTKQIGLL